jgi:hypothetical protein
VHARCLLHRSLQGSCVGTVLGLISSSNRSELCYKRRRTRRLQSALLMKLRGHRLMCRLQIKSSDVPRFAARICRGWQAHNQLCIRAPEAYRKRIQKCTRSALGPGDIHCGWPLQTTTVAATMQGIHLEDQNVHTVSEHLRKLKYLLTLSYTLGRCGHLTSIHVACDEQATNNGLKQAFLVSLHDRNRSTSRAEWSYKLITQVGKE